MKTSLPSLWDAPIALLRKDGPCGLLTAWAVLRHFHRRTSAERLIRSCGHSQEGVFTIALACALWEHKLHVNFHSDEDPAIKPTERRYYARARRLKIPMLPATPLSVLLAQIPLGRIPIVLYQTLEGEAHFSILIGATSDTVYFHDEAPLPRRSFARGWNAPEILRQCVVAEKPAATEKLADRIAPPTACAATSVVLAAPADASYPA